MNEIILLTDGSWDTHSKTGYGAYLAVFDLSLSIDRLKELVKIKLFEQTSSTKLELQTLLWALCCIHAKKSKVKIYTDSQNIIGLPERRTRLEGKNYRSNKNKPIRNYKLYQEFYRITDQVDCEIIKVKGHKQTGQKDQIDKLFTLVDKASRKALRDGNHKSTHSEL